MSYWSDTSYDIPPLAMPRRSSKLLARTLPVVLAFSFSAFVGARMMSVNPPQALPELGREAEAESKVSLAPAAPRADQAQTLALLDPNYSLGVAPTTLDESAPIGSNFELLRPSIAEAESQESQQQLAESQEAESSAAAPQVAELTKPEPEEQAATAKMPESEAQTATADVPVPPVRDFAPQTQTAELNPDPVIAPLPPQRPSALFVPDKNATFRPAPAPTPSIAQTPAPVAVPTPAPVVVQPRAPVPARTRVARATAAPAEDNRSFFEKMFGSQKSSGSALAYATPEDGGGLFGMSRVSRTTPSPFAGSGGGTAVYEIATHTVYLPNGTTLEAHSGLGEMLDNPGYVHVRMRGPTPPTTYELTLRESLFHGVQALRLNPVGGTTFGRNGLLAHTFMLGPRGDSNGCVSFRNYRAFLQAFLNGEVKRLTVVARR